MKTYILFPDRGTGYFTPEDITVAELSGFTFSPSNRVAYTEAENRESLHKAIVAEHGSNISEYSSRELAKLVLRFDPFVTPDPREYRANYEPVIFSLRKIRLNRGGYDREGYYWGIGANLYFAETEDETISSMHNGHNGHYFWALDRETAKQVFIQRHQKLLDFVADPKLKGKSEHWYYRKIMFLGDKGARLFNKEEKDLSS